MNKLASLGYLGGYRAPDKDEQSVAPKFDLMAPGLTLYTSGDAPSAYLLDASGKVVHSWTVSFEQVFPNVAKSLSDDTLRYTQYWRHATLLPDGALLVIFEGLGLVKIDRNSHVVWAKQNKAHHDLKILPDGSLLVIARAVFNALINPVMSCPSCSITCQPKASHLARKLSNGITSSVVPSI